MLKKEILRQTHLNREELHLLLDRIPDSDVAAKSSGRSPIRWNLPC